MPAALAASRNEAINRPATDSASSLSSSALWLAGEKAIKNSGKAIISAAWFFASLIKASAVRRFSSLTVEDWIGAAFCSAGEHLADLGQLFPFDHTALDRIVDIRLLVLYSLLNRHDAVDMAARERSVVDFTPLGRSEAAFYQTDVTADDRRHMLSGLQPIAIEHGNVGVSGCENDVDSAHSFFR